MPGLTAAHVVVVVGVERARGTYNERRKRTEKKMIIKSVRSIVVVVVVFFQLL